MKYEFNNTCLRSYITEKCAGTRSVTIRFANCNFNTEQNRKQTKTNSVALSPRANYTD
jgi:hypothetical protein